MSSPLKVLHCPQMVGGNSSRLAAAEKKLGLFSQTVSITGSYLNYKVDIVLHSRSRILTLLRMFWWGFFKSSSFDVIHYNFGETFLPLRPVYSGVMSLFQKIKFQIYAMFEMSDLKLNHARGRVIAVTFQGDDARQGDYCRKNYKIHFANYVDNDYYLPQVDAWKRERIEIFDRYADLIYAVNPDLLNVLPPKSKFLPYSGVDLDSWSPVWPNSKPGFIPHVIHAPSHQQVKGTKFILDAVKRLKDEGVEFKFTLIQGFSNEEAKKIYETADILVDQLLAGFYGGLSMELMTLGKPAICYMRESDLIHLPVQMKAELPIINSTPDSIYDVLKFWITENKYKLRDKGMESRKFVEKWHDPVKIAQQVKGDYEKVIERKRK